MGRINVTSRIFEGPLGPNKYFHSLACRGSVWVHRVRCVIEFRFGAGEKQRARHGLKKRTPPNRECCKLTWLVLGGDPAARSHDCQWSCLTVLLLSGG